MVWQSEKLNDTCYILQINTVRWVTYGFFAYGFFSHVFCLAQASQVIRFAEENALHIWAHNRHIHTLPHTAICPNYAKVRVFRRWLRALGPVRECATTRQSSQFQYIVAALFLLWCCPLVKTTRRTHA